MKTLMTKFLFEGRPGGKVRDYLLLQKEGF